MPLCPLQGYCMRINWKLWFETQQSTSFRAIQCNEYDAVYGVRWAIHHLLSTSSSCWKSIMAKPAKESWQVWYWAIKVWCSYLDFSNSIPIPHPLTQNYQPDIKISRDIQPLLHFAVSSNILLTTSILLCHTLWQFCRFVSQHQTYCRLQKEKKRYSGCFFLLCSLRALLEPNFLSHLEQGSSRWFFRLCLLKTLAFWKSFSHTLQVRVTWSTTCIIALCSRNLSPLLTVFPHSMHLSLYDSPVIDTGA